MKSKLFTILLMAFVLGVVYLANTGDLPKGIRQIYDFPHGDKLGHFLLMGVLSFALNWTALDARPDPKSASVIWKVSLVFALIVTIEEYSQLLLPRRTFSLFDLLFSYAGITVAALLIFLYKRE